MYRGVGWLMAGVLGVGLAWSAPAPELRGDYLEARTCNIAIGPCHFNAEVLDLGREATLAWHVREGAWEDVDLSGRTVVAVVAADRNLQGLGLRKPVRRSVLYLDAAATPRQQQALREFTTETYGPALGQVVAVVPAPITFSVQDGSEYALRVGKALRLEASRWLGDHCCSQKPFQVWYTPLVPGVQAEVGTTLNYRYQDRFLSAHWSCRQENSSFVGRFQLKSR